MKRNSYLLRELTRCYRYSEDLDSLFKLADYYKKLTPALIQDAAKRYLNPQNLVKVTLFPEKKS